MGLRSVVNIPLHNPMITPPQKVKETGFAPDVRRTLNLLIEHVRSLIPRNGIDIEVDRTNNGFFIRTNAKGNAKKAADSSTTKPRWG